MDQSFPKAQRLKSRKDIQLLFTEGRSQFQYPIQLMYRIYPSQRQPAVLAGVSVPKRRVRKAVDRNTIKRKLREIFRLNKQALYRNLPEGYAMDCMLLFVGSHIPDFDQLNSAYLKILDLWSRSITFRSSS